MTMDELNPIPASKPVPVPDDVTAATYYLGFDRSTWPGTSVMSDWWTNTPLWFAGFYLAPAPNHPNTSWMTRRSVMKSQG
jgi:hypothetical protein